jgi:prophage maintenance system killer protein
MTTKKEKNKKELENRGEIIIYKAKDGKTKLEVNLQEDTVWLMQTQIADLFGTQRPAITKHLKNIFTAGELDEKSVCSILEHTASDGKIYKTSFYNLDAILSVGYRVNSKRATQFRIWATKTLKDHLIKGYTINEKRLKQRDARLQELERVIRLFQDAKQSKLLDQSEADGLLHVITEYANTWILLNKFDQDEIAVKGKGAKEKNVLDYEKAKNDIAGLKKNLISGKHATDIFATERGQGLAAILGNINQSFGGKALYPTIEIKAAHLLYFIIKDHPFVDGNKRTGSFLFIAYLSQNQYLLRKNGEKKINDNALVALALLIAQSNPKDKDVMIALVTNLL